MKRAAVFFDRDNTLIANDGYLGDPNGVVLVAGAAEAVARARSLGFAVVVFSNQSGVARGMFAEEAVHAVNQRLDEMLHDEDARAVIDRHEFCPYHPQASVDRYRQDSDLRKPKPGMIYQAERQLALDLGRSWVIGDAPRDIDAGRAAGCRTILVTNTALAASPASWEEGAGKPDFDVRSLAEAVDVIERTMTPAVAPPVGPAAEVSPAAAAAARPEPASPVRSYVVPAPEPSGGAVQGIADDSGAVLTIAQASASAPPSAPALPAGEPIEAAQPADIAAPARLPTGEAEADEARPRVRADRARRENKDDDDSPGPARSAPSAAGAGNTLRPKARSEVLLEQILDELRRRHEQHPDADFSVSKMMAGVVQILAMAAMFIAYMQRDTPGTALITVMVGIFLQVLTISLLIMGRQR